MAEKTVFISQQLPKPIKILKWKVNGGNSVSIGRVVLLYDFEGAIKPEQRKLKSTQAGTVHKIIAQEDAIVKPGELLFELKPCIHPTVMNDMCAECGADLRKDDLKMIASVPMVHAIPELKVSEELAQKLGKADGERLLRDRKLVLLVDLDQTLIHTTNDNIPPNIKDVYHFQLYGPNSPWYHTRLRPGTHKFLNNIHPYFELHICTFGARNYAHTIITFLDKDGKFFSNRVLSRDECFDPTSKKANLKALFPCGDNMVCIIDDREDVWSHALNLIHVKPYHFFQHTGDINAPPGLDKQENDDKVGVDLTKIKIKSSEQTVEKEKLCDEKEDESDLKNNKDNNKEKTTLNLQEKTIEKREVNGDAVKSSDCIIEKDIQENNTDKADSKEVVPKNNGDVLNNADLIDIPVKESNLKDNNNGETKVQNSHENKSEITSLQQEDDLIEIDDPDDYLIYLEDILKRIHKTFYEEYDRMELEDLPDLKQVIPKVRNQVLKGTKLVFSGLVPTHIKLEQSKAYQVARSLGATVTQDLDDDTTHLVAVRPGTAKVNAGRRRKNLKIVTPDWLWSCAECWEHTDEKLYPLNSKGSKNRHPPPHCSSPEHITNFPVHNTPASRKRTASGRFMDTINPLMSFSSADIADMDKEVEDILYDESGSESSEDDNNKQEKAILNMLNKEENEESSSSDDSMTAEYPKGFKRNRDKSLDYSMEISSPKKGKRCGILENDLDNSQDSNSDEEFPSTKFRRGEQLESDLDIGQDSNSEGSVEPPDEVDDGEWNMMGAALEREFLSNN